MSRTFQLTLIASAALVLIAGLIWSYRAHSTEFASEEQGDQPIKNAARVTTSPSGETLIKFDREIQQRVDIQTEPAKVITKRKEIAAYGYLEEDPSRSFVLRAPVAGTIEAADGQTWPDTGQTLADRSAVGVIEPRLAPADRISLGDRLAAARADMESGKAALATAQAALTRARTLNADDKNVSDRAVQEAESRLAAERARLTAATQTAGLIESSLAAPGASVAHDGLRLELQSGGQVVEVLAHPGESVESGQPILRVVRFDRLLARVDVPAGEPVTPGIAAAIIMPLGEDGHPIRGERIGFAGAVDPKTQGQPFLFRLLNPSLTLRPGLSVTAYLETPGAARRGIIVPASSVVRQSGSTWVYVQKSDELFARREVVLEEPVGQGWFSTSLSPGDRVVTTGAQTLLSEEFKSKIQVGEENPE